MRFHFVSNLCQMLFLNNKLILKMLNLLTKIIYMTRIIYLFAIIILTSVCSCKKKSGCNDSTALNFDSSAQLNDGSCLYGPKVLTGNGNVIFYKSPLSGLDTINVQIDGDVK